ncbi:MAG: Rieske 2Fe-2S domain-containing protein [Verrucomicrobiae bacterium]|nr:Rieske 2Fe-2S domain-containing protein [Verrucomicrobiae bacterium]
MSDAWIKVCAADALAIEDVMRFDHGERTLIVCRTADGSYHVADGICTHEKVHLADGCVLGNAIECAKHNGRFDLRTGDAVRRPCRVPIARYDVKIEGGEVYARLG